MVLDVNPFEESSGCRRELAVHKSCNGLGLHLNRMVSGFLKSEGDNTNLCQLWSTRSSRQCLPAREHRSTRPSHCQSVGCQQSQQKLDVSVVWMRHHSWTSRLRSKSRASVS